MPSNVHEEEFAVSCGFTKADHFEFSASLPKPDCVLHLKTCTAGDLQCECPTQMLSKGRFISNACRVVSQTLSSLPHFTCDACMKVPIDPSFKREILKRQAGYHINRPLGCEHQKDFLVLRSEDLSKRFSRRKGMAASFWLHPVKLSKVPIDLWIMCEWLEPAPCDGETIYSTRKFKRATTESVILDKVCEVEARHVISVCALTAAPAGSGVDVDFELDRDEYAYIQQYLKKQFDKSQNLEKDLGITAAQAASARPAKRGGPGASRGPATDPTPLMTAVVAEAPAVHTTTRSGREVRAPSRK